MKITLFMTLFFYSILGFGLEVKLMTWNIFMIPRPFVFSHQEIRAKSIAKSVLETDREIIFFQEAFSKKSKEIIHQNTKHVYPFQTILPRSGKGIHLLDSGLYVISKIPFKVLDGLYFDECTNSDCFASKGVLLLEFTPTNFKRKFQVATTHLQAWNDSKAQTVRFDQLIQIKSLLEKHKDMMTPQLLIGDLNVDGYHSEEFTPVLNLLNMRTKTIGGNILITNGFKVDCYNVPGGDSVSWLDHILISSHTPAYLTAPIVKPFYGKIGKKLCPLSDHYSVYSQLTY